MDKNSFYFEASPYGSGQYIAKIEGFKIEISEEVFSEEKITFVETLLEIYPTKVYDLAQFCKNSEVFCSCYPEETVESSVEKLHLPIIRIDEIGGRFTYCHHELDSDHLIDVEFVGLMDSFFSVNIDG